MQKMQKLQRYIQAGDFARALKLGRELCRQAPDNPELWVTLAGIHGTTGAFQEAAKCCQKALALNPDFVVARYNLGKALQALGQKEQAAAEFEEVIRRNPENFFAYAALGNLCRELMRHERAVACFTRAVQLAPENALAHIDLGNSLKAMGDADGAITHFQRAAAIDPTLSGAQDNVIACANYSATWDRQQLFEAHRQWARHLVVPPTPPQNWANRCDSRRRLRIGYVSRDLYRHSVAYFLEPLLAGHDRDGFETICYSDVTQPDAVTEKLRRECDAWHDISTLSDDELFTRISTDQIDILIDLNGHTQGNRLAVFARRPAPVQVSYLGYPNTTGLPAIGYRLTDAWADPPGAADGIHTERLLRIDGGFLCYAPMPEAPPVAPAPVTRNGYVTFGSFNNAVKCTPAVIDVWAQILARVSDSRLILKSHWLADPGTQRRFTHLFAEHGIDPARIRCMGQFDSQAEHMAAYAEIDIGLDTFPYNGTTTTCEALWMGVPVIALAGDRHAGRVSASLLHQVGLEDLIAEDTSTYVAIAATLAENADRVSTLRAGLREKVRASPLCDRARLVRGIENAYRAMWKEFCDQAQ